MRHVALMTEGNSRDQLEEQWLRLALCKRAVLSQTQIIYALAQITVRRKLHHDVDLGGSLKAFDDLDLSAEMI